MPRLQVGWAVTCRLHRLPSASTHQDKLPPTASNRPFTTSCLVSALYSFRHFCTYDADASDVQGGCLSDGKVLGRGYPQHRPTAGEPRSLARRVRPILTPFPTRPLGWHPANHAHAHTVLKLQTRFSLAFLTHSPPRFTLPLLSSAQPHALFSSGADSTGSASRASPT